MRFSILVVLFMQVKLIVESPLGNLNDLHTGNYRLPQTTSVRKMFLVKVALARFTKVSWRIIQRLQWND